MKKKLNIPKDFWKDFKGREDFDEFFNALFKEGVNQMLKAEMSNHLGYEKHAKEGENRGIRKYTKTKSIFPHDQAALKSVYLAISNIEKKWTMPIRNWGIILQQFLIKFEDRCRI